MCRLAHSFAWFVERYGLNNFPWRWVSVGSISSNSISGVFYVLTVKHRHSSINTFKQQSALLRIKYDV